MSAPSKTKSAQNLYRDPAAQQPPADNPDAPLLDQVLEATVAKLNTLAARCQTDLNEPGIAPLVKSLRMAAAIERLEKALDREVMAKVMKLMNSKLGFMTDKGPHAWKEEDKTPYSETQIKPVIIEGLLRGAYLYDNEINVIAHNLYLTKQYWERRCKEISGITDLDVVPGIPTVHNNQTVVRVSGSWKLNGVPNRLVGTDGQPGRVFAVQTNRGSNADNTTGKALKKAYKAIYEKTTGTIQTDDDPEVREARAQEEISRVAGSRSDAVAGKLGNGSDAARAPALPEALRADLDAQGQRLALSPAEWRSWLGRFGAERVEGLTPENAGRLLTALKAEPDPRQPGEEGN